MIRVAALVCALATCAGPAAACRLALVLALDVSSSVDPTEDALQRRGLAAALIAPEVQAAFFAVADPVALYAFEWSGVWDQTALTPGWVMIETPDDLSRAALAIADSRRSRNDMPTGMGAALGHGAIRLAEGPDCLYRTIDVAGDGENNEGYSPAIAYRTFPFDGVTVNALVINGADYEGEVNLLAFFHTEVIRGPGAFVEVASGYADYERAMRRKLLRELSVLAIGALPPVGDTG